MAIWSLLRRHLPDAFIFPQCFLEQKRNGYPHPPAAQKMDDGDSGSDWDSEEHNSFSSPTTINFRFGSRTITATGVRSDREHTNVLRLSVHHSTLQLIIQTLLRCLPLSLRSWAHSSYPEWFLPTNIVLKRQKDGWDEEFDTERSTYEELACLQGLVIPTCYGQVQSDGKRALVLSDIGGACVASPEGAVLTEQDVQPLFEQALGTLVSHGISHGDLKLDNFDLVGNPGNRAIMIVDLESVDIIQPEPDRAWIVQSDVSFLMQAYRDHLVCLKYDGLLLPQEKL